MTVETKGATGKAFPKPLPLEDADQQPYWDGANRHELVVQRCAACGKLVHPPGPGCPWCGAGEFSWVSLGSEVDGSVYSFIVVHRPFLQSFVDESPYVVALVDVDDAPGIRITANIVDVDPSAVSIGMRVRMTWERRAPGREIPQWRAA
jgi:uncharacterized OB-fold protein